MLFNLIFKLKYKGGLNKQNWIQRLCQKYMITLTFLFTMTQDDRLTLCSYQTLPLLISRSLTQQADLKKNGRLPLLNRKRVKKRLDILEMPILTTFPKSYRLTLSHWSGGDWIKTVGMHAK